MKDERLKTSPITVRRAATRDADILVSFNRAMARETEGKDLPYEVIAPGVAGLMQHPEYGFYLVAEAQAQVVGSLLVTYEWSDWRNGLLWWVQSVYIRLEWRRRGVYGKLYETAKTLAQEAGNVRGFRLYVEKNNLTAQRSYSALGMKKAHYLLFEEIL